MQLGLSRPLNPMSLDSREPMTSSRQLCFQVYLRGEAHLASRQGSKADADFQKIIDHRGLV